VLESIIEAVYDRGKAGLEVPGSIVPFQRLISDKRGGAGSENVNGVDEARIPENPEKRERGSQLRIPNSLKASILRPTRPQTGRPLTSASFDTITYIFSLFFSPHPFQRQYISHKQASHVFPTFPNSCVHM
jgi:hypothetical protein